MQSETWQMFATDLANKLSDDELNDVSFILNDDKTNNEVVIKANRGLLSIFSPVFKSMFKNGMKESLDDNDIPIKDTDSKSFELFIQYFYGMDPPINASNIGSMSYLAEKYLIDGLQKICVAFLHKSLSMNNLIPILESLIAYHQDVECISNSFLS